MSDMTEWTRNRQITTKQLVDLLGDRKAEMIIHKKKEHFNEYPEDTNPCDLDVDVFDKHYFISAYKDENDWHVEGDYKYQIKVEQDSKDKNLLYVYWEFDEYADNGITMKFDENNYAKFYDCQKAFMSVESMSLHCELVKEAISVAEKREFGSPEEYPIYNPKRD